MGPQFEAAASKRTDLTLIRIDIKDWSSPVAQQFAIQSLPNLIMYNPEGEVVKRGRNSVGHELLPNAIPDGGDEGGASIGSWLIVIPALAVFALLLFVLTKAMGPRR